MKEEDLEQVTVRYQAGLTNDQAPRGAGCAGGWGGAAGPAFFLWLANYIFTNICEQSLLFAQFCAIHLK